MTTCSAFVDVRFDSCRIGKVIQDLRKAQKWSQEHLAEVLNVDVKSVGRWERGKISFDKVSCLTVFKLAKAFDVDIETILAL